MLSYLVDLASCLITGFNDFGLLLHGKGFLPTQCHTSHQSRLTKMRDLPHLALLVCVRTSTIIWNKVWIEMSSWKAFYFHKVECLPNIAIIQFQAPIQAIKIYNNDPSKENVWKKIIFAPPTGWWLDIHPRVRINSFIPKKSGVIFCCSPPHPPEILRSFPTLQC